MYAGAAGRTYEARESMPSRTRPGPKDGGKSKAPDLVLHCGHAGLICALEAAGIVTLQWDGETDELHLSANAIQVLGISANALTTGAQLLSFIPEHDRNRVRQTLRLTWDERKACQINFHLTHPGGDDVWLQMRTRYQSTRPGRGELRGVIVEVTDSRQADEAHSLLASIISSSGDAIISKTIDGNINSWNEAAETLFGWTAEEALGQPVTLIIPPDLHAEEREIQSQLRHGERIAHYETQRIDRRGRRLEVSLTVSPVRDKAGRIVGASKIIRDITAAKQAVENLRDREALLRTLGDNLPGALYQIARCPHSGEKRFRYVSAGIQSLLGIPHEEVVADPMTLYGAILEEDLPAVLAAEDAAERVLGPFDCVFRQRHRSGEIRWVHCKSAPRRVADGTIVWDGIILDVTDQKQAEEALRQADRRKDEFLAMLAHELRNPLAPIRNAVDFLGLKSNGDADLRWAREIIDRQLAQLTRLVDDLLDVSRITRNKIALRAEQLSVSAVVEQALETSRPLIDAGQHELVVHTPPESLWIEGDRTRIAQVLSNLLNNAAKYTRPGGRIELKVHHEDPYVVMSVRDNGIGLDANMLAAVFDLFTQADTSLERSQGGLGIGLTVARRLVEMHGGMIEASSAGPGQGSEFRVRLPLLKVEENEQPCDSQACDKSPAKPCKRILIVDDNRDSADTLASLLRVKGHDVRSAYSGERGLEIARMHRPDIVILDIGMPGMNGYEVARHLRASQECSAAMLIAMTGWGQPDDRRRSQEAGFDEHLVKPVNLQLLEPLLV